MNRVMLKSKIYRATVTNANLNYQDSISIDKKLCDAADLYKFEKVDIYNITNGERFSIYVIYGKPGEIVLNGAAARRVHESDLIINASYAVYDLDEFQKQKQKLVFVNSNNEITTGL